MDSDKPTPGGGASLQEALRDAAPYLGLGLQLAGGMAFFVALGYFLDVWLNTLPWLTVAGAVLGMMAVMLKLLQINTELGRNDKRKEKPRDEVP